MDALNKKTKDRIFIVLMLAIPVTHFLVFWLYLNFSSIAIAFQDCYIFLWIFYLVYPVGFSILFIDVGIKKN